MSNSKSASDLTYEELKSLLESKKNERLSTLEKEIASLEKNLLGRRNELAELTGEAVSPMPKRGRKLSRSAAVGNGTKVRRGRRSGLKDKILAFLTPKGKGGAHIDEIAAHVGKPKINVNAFLATTGRKAGVKGKGKRSGIYYLHG